MTNAIYGIVHRPSQRWYVGRTANVSRRWRNHRASMRHGSKLPFHQALRDHAATEFTWVVLQLCSHDNCARLEQLWIGKLSAFTNGFNCTDGGEFTPGDYPHIRAKMSVAGKARVDRPFLGRRHSSEAIRLIREAAARRGSEWRARISLATRGRKASAETRAKLSAAHTGRCSGQNNGFFGKHHSEETKAKIAASLLGRKRKPYRRIGK